MWYEMNYSDEADLLRVEIYGQRPSDLNELKRVSHEAWTEIARRTNDLGKRKLLVVSHATGSYSTVSAYEINTTLAKCGVRSGWMIAFVALDPDSYDEVKFCETIAVNRGFQVGVFANEEAGRQWLADRAG